MAEAVNHRAFALFPREGDTIRGDVRTTREGPARSAVVVVHGFKGFKDWAFFWSSIATFDRWDEATKRAWRSAGRIHVANQRTGQQMPLDLTLLEDIEAHRERLDVLGAAERVAVPWLIVHGTEDATVDPSDARALADSGTLTQLKMVEGTGHTFNARHPLGHIPRPLEEAVDATVAHFVRTLHR